MTYTVLTLNETFRETGNQIKSIAGANANRGFRFDKFLIRIEEILSNSRVKRVLIDVKNTFSPAYFSGAESIRNQLLRLEKAGKEVHFYAREYKPVQLYLASACSHHYIHPLGFLSFLGVARTFMFFKSALDKQKIKTEVYRRGAYKSAADTLSSNKLDDANREQHDSFIAEIMEVMRSAIAEGYKKDRKELDELLDGLILNADDAKTKGWVSDVISLENLKRKWKAEKHKEHKIRKIGDSFGRGKRIGVLFFEGAIIDGTSRQHPVFGQSIGSDSFIPQITALKKNKRIKAVVLRINSGGGSATASDEILDALAELREKKPLVVSMSEVAGSGAYWISTQADRLFAERTTLTGSIGVISLLLYLQDFLKQYGINTETIKHGKYADIGNGLRKSVKKERELLDGMVESLYNKFLSKVADFRKKTIEEVRSIAEGRIWAGNTAQEHGLVDEIGGLSDALNYCKERLDLKRAKVEFFPKIHYSFIERKIMQASRQTGLGGLDPQLLLSILGGRPANPLSATSMLNRIDPGKALLNELSTPHAIMPGSIIWKGQ